MKILQLSVRLNEGGAASIALDLHRRLLNSGVNSTYAYGYGKKAGSNPKAMEIPNVIKCSSRFNVLPNFVYHRLFGKDIFPPLGPGKKSFLTAINEADIVHIHILHSYFLPYFWFIKHLLKENKKVVWSIHDSWLLTGRCAITDGCLAWQNGCGSCITQKNYPPSFFDFSRAEFEKKKSAINSLGKNLNIVCLSRDIANTYRQRFHTIKTSVIGNGLDMEIEKLIPQISSKQATDKTKILIIANDLAYGAKTNPKIILEVSALKNSELHIVGKNSPFSGFNIINHGEITSREQLVKIYLMMDLMLFTSIVDTFPLVIMESLACGTPVLAVKSPAAETLLGLVGAKPLGSDLLIKHIKNKTWWNIYDTQGRQTLQNNALSVFSGKIMCKNYMDIYQDMLK